MRKQTYKKVLLLLIGLSCLGLFVFASKPAAAANPTTINFQGKIVNANGTNVADGTYSFIFRIYNTSSPTMTTSCTSTASCLWQETQASITVTSGVFQVELGASCALTSSSCNNSTGGPINFGSTSSLYLTMQFNGDTSGSNGGFMSPVIHLTSVPFARNSDALGGLAAGNFVQLAQGLQTDSSTTNASIAINKTGATANILTLQKSSVNVLVIDNNGAATFQSDSSNAFTVQSNTGSNILLSVDTSSNTVGIGYNDISAVSSTVNIATGGGNTQTVNIGSGAFNSSVGISSGAADISLYVNSTTNGVVISPNVDSSAAFAIKNSGGSKIFNADTTKQNSNNLVANSSFESAVSSWSALNAGAASQSSSEAYEGNDSLLIATGTNAGGGGASYSTGSSFLSSATTYTLSAYVKTDSAKLVSTLEIGRMDNGTYTNTATNSCLTAQSLPTNDGWQKFTCSFTTGTVSGNPAIYFKQTDAVNRNLYIDDILLQTSTNADTDYHNGTINFTGATIDGAVVLQNAINSSNALQVQNSAGTQVFNVDTTDSNLISNPGFETNSTGWTAQGTNTTIRRDTTQTYLGVASLKVTQVTSTTANSGAQLSLNPIVTAASTTYTVSFYGRLDSGSAALTDVSIRYSPDGTANSDCSAGAINTATMVTTGWTRFVCQVSSATTPTTSGFIRINSTGTTIHTYYIDGVQMEAGTTVSAYGAGAFSFNGIIGSPVVFKGSTSSVNAFQIQDSSSTNYLNVDTLNARITFGASDTTGTLLVLDTDTDAAYSAGSATNSAAEVDGGMFYSSTNHSFMCGVAGSWETCTGLLYSNTSVPGAVNTCTTACTAVGVAPIPANYCKPGRVIHVITRGLFGSNNPTASTMVFEFRYGTSATRLSDTIVGGVSPTITPTANLVGVPWSIDYTLICFSTTSMSGSGTLTYQNSTTNTTTNIMLQMPATTTSGLTTTSAANLYLFMAFGTSNAANTITGSQYIVTGN